MVTAWFLASYIAAVINCLPINHFWTPLGPGYCFNFDVYFLGVEVAEVIIDTIILVLPVHMISSLQLSRGSKALLSSIFLLGVL